MTLLTIPDRLRNLNHDILRVSDWQSKSDLDSICNTCDVYITKRKFSTGYFLYLKKSIDGTGGSNFTNPRRHYLIHVFLKCISRDKNMYLFYNENQTVLAQMKKLTFNFSAYLEDGVLQTDSVKLRQHYMNSTTFYIDLLCLLPLDFLYLSLEFQVSRRMIVIWWWWCGDHDGGGDGDDGGGAGGDNDYW